MPEYWTPGIICVAIIYPKAVVASIPQATDSQVVEAPTCFGDE
jgi:hypothetical protein